MNGYIIMLSSCNMYCEYCYYNSGMIEKGNDVIDKKTLTNAIDFLARNEAESIQLTGGECFVDIKLLKKAIYLSKLYGLTVNVATNLKAIMNNSSITEEEWFDLIDKLIVSIHIDANTKPNYYIDFFTCIKKLKERNKNIALIYIISAVNYKHTNQIIEDCEALNIDLQLQPVSFTGANPKIANKYGLNILDSQSIKSIIDSIKHWSRNTNDIHDMQDVYNIIDFLNQKQPSTKECYAGVELLVIAPNGNISPCFIRNDVVLGNVNEEFDESNLKEFCSSKKECLGIHCFHHWKKQ